MTGRTSFSIDPFCFKMQKVTINHLNAAATSTTNSMLISNNNIYNYYMLILSTHDKPLFINIKLHHHIVSIMVFGLFNNRLFVAFKRRRRFTKPFAEKRAIAPIYVIVWFNFCSICSICSICSTNNPPPQFTGILKEFKTF